MAEKYRLEVNLIQPQYHVDNVTVEGIQIGDNLEGEVILSVMENVNCRGVWIEIGYHDRGSGTPNENRLIQTMIFEGELRRNQNYSHHILFQIPERGPTSYQGKLVKIEWFVRIRIDIPYWFDKRKEFYFNVLPKFISSRDEVDYSIFEEKPEDMERPSLFG